MSYLNRCHSAGSHSMFYKPTKWAPGLNEFGCGGGTTIFNFNYGCSSGGCCGGGWFSGGNFWSGLGLGFGMGFANLFSGLMGGFMGGFGGMFGGFGMPGLYGGGLSGLWGGGGSSASDLSSSSGSGHSGKCKDKDASNLNKLWARKKKFANIEPAKWTANDTKELKKLYNEIKPLTTKPLDDSHASENKQSYKNLLDDLVKLAKIHNITLDDEPVEDTPEPMTVHEPPANQDQPENLDQPVAQVVPQTPVSDLDSIPFGDCKVVASNLQGLKLPEGMEFASDNEDFTSENKITLEKAEDSGKPLDVIPSSGFTYSTQTIRNSKFPLYITITDKGGKYKYKGTLVDGKAVYKTPVADGNNNHYILVKIKGKLRLYQPKEWNNLDLGQDNPDKQNT